RQSRPYGRPAALGSDPGAARSGRPHRCHPPRARDLRPLPTPDPAARRPRRRGHILLMQAGLGSPRLSLPDLARVASVGLRTRRVRAALSALGIAIGVAAIVAVLGLSSPSPARLLPRIDRLR